MIASPISSLKQSRNDDHSVRIIHGACDGEFPVAGHSIASVRASLVDALNIGADCIAFINGEEVEPTFVLSIGETLEFVHQFGCKGLGDLFTPKELIARLKINEAQYEELKALGLPTVRLAGECRHHENAVDRFFESLNSLAATNDGGELVFGPINVNRADKEVTVHGKTYSLDVVQFDIVSYLVARKGEWATRSDIQASSPVLALEDRLDRNIKALGERIKPLATHIESSTKGYRLVLENRRE